MPRCANQIRSSTAKSLLRINRHRANDQMRTPEEIQARLIQLAHEYDAAKGKPNTLVSINAERYALRWVLGHDVSKRKPLASKIIKNAMSV